MLPPPSDTASNEQPSPHRRKNEPAEDEDEDDENDDGKEMDELSSIIEIRFFFCGDRDSTTFHLVLQNQKGDLRFYTLHSGRFLRTSSNTAGFALVEVRPVYVFSSFKSKNRPRDPRARTKRTAGF